MLKVKTSVAAVALAISSLSSVYAADAVVAGDDPGTFKIPGSDTSVGFYGFVKADVIKDLNASNSGSFAFDGGSIGIKSDPSGINTDSRKQQLNVTAQTSRFGFKSTTPSEAGKISTVIEGDFVGSKYRLRHAYGTLSSTWGSVLAGQNWSLFRSPESIPETLDFNGQGSVASLREPQVRYTTDLGSVGNFAVAAEVPANGLSSNSVVKIPVISAALIKSGDFGSVALRGLTNPVAYETIATTTQDSKSQTKYGYGVSLGAGIKVGNADLLQLQAIGGQGISQYVENANYNLEIVVNDQIKLTTVQSYTAGYQHAWNKVLRSNLSYGRTELGKQYRDAVGTPQNKTVDSVFANLIWAVAKNTEFGVELAHGQRKLSDGTSGKLDRFQTSFFYSF